MSLYGVPNSGSISSCHSFVACLKGSRPSIFSVPPSPAPGPSGAVPVSTGTAPVPTGLDHAALTSIVLGVAARGAGTLTSSMPFAPIFHHEAGQPAGEHSHNHPPSEHSEIHDPASFPQRAARRCFTG